MKSALNNPSPQNPILIIDRLGLIGEPLSVKLSKNNFVVFVSSKSVREKKINILEVPFLKKNPKIPDGKYSHIVFIDEEALDLEILPKIIDKVKDVNSDFIFVQGIFIEGEYSRNKVMTLYPSARVVIHGDIFDNQLVLKKENFKSIINKFIYQAQAFGKIQVLRDGLRSMFPVALEDVVDGLISLIRKENKSKNSLFYIFPKYPSTELSVAHMIQKMNPEIMVDFTKHDPRPEKITYPLGGENLLIDKYPLAKKIRNIDIKKTVKPYGIGVSEIAKRKKISSAFIVWILLFIFISPLIFTYLFSFLGAATLQYAGEETGEGRFSSAKSSVHLSQALYSAAEQTMRALYIQAEIIGREGNLNNFSENITEGCKTSEVLSQALTSEAYLAAVINGKSQNPTDDFLQSQNYLRSSIVSLNKIKAEGKISAPILQNLEKINPLINLVSNALDILPNIFGMDGPKTYLILFQDNMQLRPGGGLINTYGILKFNLGKITEFSLHDVASADKQLRGHVEPPFAVRRYLPSEHWYMKDSNFDVDFSQSASFSANFLSIETGQKANGIIGVDMSFIKNILHAIGPVMIKKYSRVVNEDNFDALIQSPPDNYFSRYVYDAIIKKIMAGDVSHALILQTISDAIIKKDLLFSFNDFQNIFTVNGWSSSLWDERINASGVINDFVGINEANLGNNDINYLISRQVSQKISIGNVGNVSEELTIYYKNQSVKGENKDYKNYLRVILPGDANLSGISINDNIQNIVNAITDPLVYEAQNFKVPQGLEVEKTDEDSKTIYGFLVKIPAGGIVKVTLKYSLVQDVAGLNAFSYDLKLFKQPGVDNLPYSLTLNYPNYFRVAENSDGINKIGSSVTSSKEIVSDQDLNIDFVTSE